MRIRTVKPEFWRSDDVAALGIEDRLLFIGLWSYVDDSGIGVDKVAHICADLFAPDLEANPTEVFGRVTGGLHKLSERGMIVRYKVDGKPYLYVTNWKNHQRIDKPSRTRFPMPDKADSSTSDEFAEPSRSIPEKLGTGTGEQGNRGTGESVVTLSDADAPDPDDDFNLIEEELSIEETETTPGYPADFNTFWNTYPRRGGKGAACAAFLKAKKRASVETIIAAAERMKNDPNLPADGTLIALPATWLNQDRWEDDPLPARVRSKSDERLMAGYELTQRAAARSMTANTFPAKELGQ